MEAIFNRRSIKKYKSEAVPAEIIKDLLKAAMNAPSAGNERPWQFVVIDDKEKLQAIPRYVQDLAEVREAPLVIMVCGDETKEIFKGYWVQDCAAATENILLEAQAKGLGSLWIGIYPNDDRILGLRWLFGVPAHIYPFAVVTVGYPAAEVTVDDRYDDKIVHHNQW